jgi:predicted alpha/beta hydrolase family esterase
LSKGKRVVIVHGAYGHPGGNWFPWLKQEIEKIGHEVVVPKFPTPENQDFSVWHKVFETEVGPLTRDMILVGHRRSRIRFGAAGRCWEGYRYRSRRQ